MQTITALSAAAASAALRSLAIADLRRVVGHDQQDGSYELAVPDDLAATVEAALQAYDPTKVKPPVPQSVTRAQAKIALYRSGHLDEVKTAVAADPETQIWFDEAMTWERQNPHIVDLGEKLLGGSDEIDALFIAAAQIAA